MAGSNATVSGLKSALALCRRNQSIYTIDLSNNEKFGDKGVKLITQFLKLLENEDTLDGINITNKNKNKNNSKKRPKIRFNISNIGAKDGELLGHLVKSCSKNIQELSVGKNILPIFTEKQPTKSVLNCSILDFSNKAYKNDRELEEKKKERNKLVLTKEQIYLSSDKRVTRVENTRNIQEKQYQKEQKRTTLIQSNKETLSWLSSLNRN